MKTDLLIIHGRDGVGDAKHHQIWLGREFERIGKKVEFPVLKGMFSLDAEETIRELNYHIVSKKPNMIACHSLGSIALLHVLKRNKELYFDKLLFAAPARFDPPRDLFPSFYPVPQVDINKRAKEIMLTLSKNDPYRTNGEGKYIEKFLGIDADWIEKGKHLNGEQGFGEWPEALSFLRTPI